MPLDYTSRNIAAGGASPYIPLATNNPAFQVEIIPMDGRLEQKPDAKSGAGQISAIGVGDTIRGEEVSGTREKGKRAMGRVVAVEKDNESITGYKILGANGKEIIVDPSSAVKVDVNGEDPVPTAQQTQQLEKYTPQNRVMLYEHWKMSRLNNDI